MLGRPTVLRLALASLLLLAPCATASGQGGALRVGVPSLPETLDPAAAGEGPGWLIARQVFDTLVQYREGSSDIEPGLATQWSASRDGLSWSFRLRDGVRFHDGTPLTAQHVAVSLERLLNPGHPHAPDPNPVAPRLLRGAPGVVKEIRVPEPRTVQITLRLPYAPLLTVLAHPAFSVVLAAAGEGGATRWLGSGPFAVAEAAPGTLTLEANRWYWGGAPKLSRVVFLAEPDEARGEADVDARMIEVWIPSGAPTRLAGALSVPGWRMGYLALQTEREPFKRKKARQAVAAALDAGLIGTAVEPLAMPLQAFLPPGIWGRTERPPVTGASPGAARRLLAEAGLARGIAPTLLSASVSPPLDAGRVAEAVQAALGAAGIAVSLAGEAAETALRVAQQGEHQMVLLEANADGGDPHLLLYPLSTTEGAIRGPSAWNLSFYRNPKLDNLLIRGSQLSFRPERQRVYARAQAVLAEDVPWIPLYVRLHWAVARPEVRNLRLHPSGIHRFDRVLLEPSLVPGRP